MSRHPTVTFGGLTTMTIQDRRRALDRLEAHVAASAPRPDQFSIELFLNLVPNAKPKSFKWLQLSATSANAMRASLTGSPVSA